MTDNQLHNKSFKQKATKAYTTPRSFGGFQIPITLQSTTLRNYCEKNNLIFHLHVVENASHYDGIAMCSISMLPSDREYRRSIVKRLLNQGCALHFTFEQIVTSSVKQLADLEELAALIELSAHHRATNSHSLTNLL